MKTQDLTAYQDWALDNGFEYIEIITGNNCSGSSIVAGYGDREKYGLPRLMEALQSNMWSTMERKTVSSGSSSSGSSSNYGSSVFHIVEQHHHHHHPSNAKELNGVVSIDNNIHHHYQAMEDNNNDECITTIITDDNITHVNRNIYNGSNDNDNNHKNEFIDMNYRSSRINEQHPDSESLDNLNELRTVINHDTRGNDNDNEEHDFAELDILSDFICQVSTTPCYVHIYIYVCM